MRDWRQSNANPHHPRCLVWVGVSSLLHRSGWEQKAYSALAEDVVGKRIAVEDAMIHVIIFAITAGGVIGGFYAIHTKYGGFGFWAGFFEAAVAVVLATAAAGWL
jgi:hypothetical protein